MKKIIVKRFHLLCVLGLLAASGCNTFESEPLEWTLEEDVVNPKDSLASTMKGLYYAVYYSLPSLHNRLSSSYLDAATDDGVPTRDMGGSSSLENYRNGRLSPENIASLDGNAWKNFYTGIRRANLFLEKIKDYPTGPNLTADEKKRMIAETRFLRAYFYFELMKRWGGVPMVGDNVFNYDDDWNIPRSSMKDVKNYILNEVSPDVEGSCYNDLYEAMVTVPTELESIVGRVNKGAVLGFLSHLKLYMASPLYAEKLAEEDETVAEKERWQEAADAAKAVIDLGIYGLHKTSVDDEGVAGTAGFLEFFGDAKTIAGNNEEAIFFKLSGDGTSPESNNSPIGYQRGKCWGYTSPSQNLVDAFLTLDGKRIDDPTSKYPYDPQNPYANRDPRLTYTIFYNGSTWLKRAVETFDGGLDRPYSPGRIATQTGYYLRKFLGLNENRNDNSGFNSIPHNYNIIRYAEILLNYAEALNEMDRAGNSGAHAAVIEDCLIQLRERAGIEAGDDGRYGLPTSYTYEEMQEIIRNERRIELAFEEHRFWDIRRWKIAEDVMNEPVRGVEIVKLPDGSFQYEYVDVRTSTFDENKMYWYPIPRTEMVGNPELTQNPGWDY